MVDIEAPYLQNPLKAEFRNYSFKGCIRSGIVGGGVSIDVSEARGVRPAVPVVSFASVKGGTGKTSVTLLMADALAALGVRVAVVDLDPQANASIAMGWNTIRNPPTYTTLDVLHSNRPGTVQTCLEGTSYGDRVQAILADLNLAEMDSDSGRFAGTRLRTSLLDREPEAGSKTDPGSLADACDIVLIDCPPSQGNLLLNALVASDLVLGVVSPDVFSLHGLELLTRAIETVPKTINPSIALHGVIVNVMPAVGVEASLRLDELLDSMGELVWLPPIPERRVIKNAQGAQSPVSAYGYESKKVTEVTEVHAAALIERLGLDADGEKSGKVVQL